MHATLHTSSYERYANSFVALMYGKCMCVYIYIYITVFAVLLGDFQTLFRHSNIDPLTHARICTVDSRFKIPRTLDLES